MSSSASTPATSSSRSAITSVPEPGEPTEIVLPLHVLDRLDVRVGLDDDLGDVRIQRPERLQRQRLVEALLPAHGVDRRVLEREGDVGVAVRRRAAGCRPTPTSSRPWSVSRAARRSAGRRARRRRPGRRRPRRRSRSRAGPHRPAGRSASTPQRVRPSTNATANAPRMLSQCVPGLGGGGNDAQPRGLRAPSRLRFSASCSAPVMSSSSPASTCSRLCTVRPSTRWSVTRRCGKL